MQLKPDFSHTGEYYHGSCSPSLVSFCNAEKPGLICAGDLLEQGLIPFSGELKNGIGDGGVNHEGISTVGIYNISTVVRYTGARSSCSNPFFWRPDQHEEMQIYNQKKIDEKLQEMVQANEVEDEQEADDIVHIVGCELDQLARSKVINQRRKDIYSTLGLIDKMAILKRFPIVYGMRRKGMVNRVTQAQGREFILPPYIPAEEVTLYVPDSQVAFTKKFLNKKRVGVVRVDTFSALADCYVNHLHLDINDSEQLKGHLLQQGSVSPDAHVSAIEKARLSQQKVEDSILKLAEGDYPMDFWRNFGIEMRWRLQNLF